MEIVENGLIWHDQFNDLPTKFLVFAPALTRFNLTGNIVFQTPFGSYENFLPCKKQ